MSLIITWRCDRAAFRPVDSRQVRWLEAGDPDFALFCRLFPSPVSRKEYDQSQQSGCRFAAVIENSGIVAMAAETAYAADSRLVSGFQVQPSGEKHGPSVVSFVTANIVEAGLVAMLVTNDGQADLARIAESLGYRQAEVIRTIHWRCDRADFRPVDYRQARWLGWGDGDYELFRQFSPDLTRGRFESMRNSGIRVGVLVVDGKIVSVACEQPRSKTESEVVSVATPPPLRGKGYARVVTSFVTAQILADGHVPITETRETNAPMIRVAESIGYRRDEPGKGGR